jgi:hypothetical protein
MSKLIGSDLHGSFDAHPEIWDKVDVIVTGETWEEFEGLMEKYVGPKKPIFLNPLPKGESPDLGNIVSHKEDIINTMEIDEYYEDQKEQADLLKILCPNCKIILLK